MSKPTPSTLSTEQAADLLHVDPRTLTRARRVSVGDREIVAVQVGRVLRWPARPLREALGLVTGK
ncbi:hypothetical protein [Corynebacterium sp. c8Ua_99]|uniref:hypothetical protein n=1 Tax=Corynebacterium sp. c8Ua_99 TaxID=3032335 RepID=UPI003262D0D4